MHIIFSISISDSKNFDMLEVFLQFLKHQNNDIKAKQFFSINFNFFSNFIAVIASYIVIIIQMSAEE